MLWAPPDLLKVDIQKNNHAIQQRIEQDTA